MAFVDANEDPICPYDLIENPDMIKLNSIFLLFALALPASAQEIRVISQPDAPIRISSYTAKYQEDSRYIAEGVKHELSYENTSDQTIIAIQFGLISFNVFNEFLGQMSGFAMDGLQIGKSKKGSWNHRPYAAFSFYTGVAYVRKVRFSGGDIWEANFEAVAEELRTIEEDFEASRLTNEERGEQ